MLDNNFEYVDLFEKKVAKFSGAKFGVAVDSCSNALFLSLQYWKRFLRDKKKYTPNCNINIPRRTYLSVPMQVIHAGFEINWVDSYWQGIYSLYPTNIIDGAVIFNKGMYCKKTLFCISFQHSKPLGIGKGGMILTDNKKAYEWLKMASFDGRNRNCMVNKDKIPMIGWHMNMIPDEAVKGLLKFNTLSDNNPYGNYETYRDVSKLKIFKEL